MAVEDLTLDEMFALEKAHPPLVGSRTSVFLEPHERPGSSGSKSLEELSDNEFRILKMLGAGLATREIAAQLNLTLKTIQAHQENIKRKLQKRLEQNSPDQNAVLLKAK